MLADEAVSSLTSPGAVFWPLADNLGSVRDIVDSNQTIRTHLFYDAYGNVTSRNEYDSAGATIAENDWDSQAIDHWFTYTGRLYDEDADLYNLRARWYDAATGRFVNPDPIGFAAGDVNLYRYVGNNPINHTDPSGLSGGSGGAGGGCIPSNRQGITFLDSPGNGYSNRLQVEAFRNRQSWVHSNVPWQHQTTEMHRYLDALVQDGATLAPELLEWSRGAGVRFDSYELEEAILVMGAHTAALHDAHDAAALARSRVIFFIRVGGAFQFVAGVGEAAFGTFLGTLGVAAEVPSWGTSTVLVVLGYGFAFNGVDNASAGLYSLWTGEQKDTLTEQAIEQVTGSRTLATSANNAALTVGNIGNPARAILRRSGSALRSTSRSVGRTACDDAGGLVFDRATKSWTSRGGLVYGQGSVHGNRVKHVFDHLVQNPSKATHSIFNVERNQLVGLVDEAWMSRVGPGALGANGNRAWVVEMGRVVGTNGEAFIQVIARDGTTHVITAFPKLLP